MQQTKGDNFSPRMPCQWYVRGGEEGKRRILIGQTVSPTPFGMAFGRIKLSTQALLQPKYSKISDGNENYKKCLFCLLEPLKYTV
jgi:hypothetical protein